ncbi:MAG: sensor histidine kinase [Gammaproteobacteria bacterium]|jgi:PAS domain S-box-containing protein|nr:sensor histidine kinase [Gammaproteobacteria bacterium]
MLVTIVEFIFGAALFINAALFIPQIIKILRERSAKGVSLITFAGFLLIQLAVVLHGVINHDLLLVYGYLISMLACGTVVFLTVIYRHEKEKESEEITLKEIIAQLPGHVYWKDKNSISLGCNTNNWRDFGLKSLEDFKGRTDYDFQSKTEADHVRAIDAEVMRTGQIKIAEEPATTNTGEKILYLSHKTPLRDKNKNILGILGVSLDITHAKQEVEDRLAILEGIIALMPGHVYWKDKEGVLLGCNDLQAKSLGFKTPSELIGKTDYDLFSENEAKHIRNVDAKVMESGERVLAEETNSFSDGTYSVLLSDKMPLRNSKGEITGIVGISIDITDRKKAEKFQIEKEVAEKNTAVMNILAGSIAHELRTPLSAINSHIDLLKLIIANKENTPIEKEARIEKGIYTIKLSIKEAAQVIDMILTKLRNVALGKVEDKNFQKHSMLETVTEALETYPFKGQEKGLISFKNREEDFTYTGDLILTKHVLFNLIKNDLQAIQEAAKGEITIEMSTKDGKFNQVFITDTAVGLSEEMLAKIFNKFETTDKTHSGAGLGLTFCKLVMESYGGEINCTAKEGQYTRFILSFPKDK